MWPLCKHPSENCYNFLRNNTSSSKLYNPSLKLLGYIKNGVYTEKNNITTPGRGILLAHPISGASISHWHTYSHTSA